jgi:hypothetical protein
MRRTQIAGIPIILCAVLQGCQVQLVSPYSADVQKRASDMISEVSAWELQMRSDAGTPEADPRQPDIKAKFANWQGEVEAMAAIEAALSPSIIKCDKLAAIVAQSSSLPIPGKGLPASVSSPSPTAAIAPQSCETQVFQNLAQTLVEMQEVAERQCELPWLTDSDFQTIGERQAAAGAPGSVAPTDRSSIGSAPTADQRLRAHENCAKIFRPLAAQGGQGLGHGLVVAPVIRQLYDIVYIETRKSTAAKQD